MKLLGHILLPAILSLAGTLTVVAQNHTVSLDWGGLIPAGGGNFRNETSWAAPSASYEYHILPRLSVGASLGLAVASEQGATRDRYNGDLVTASSERRLTAIPMQARLRCYPFGRHTALQPFISVGGGVQYARFFINGDAIQSTHANSWGGIFTASVGLRWYPWHWRGFLVEASGGWHLAGNSFEIMNTKSQRNIEVRLGVGFSL